MAYVTCRDLALGYDGRPIVTNLNFEIHAGDYLCVVGENGAGKSTLIKTLLGLQEKLAGSIETGDGLKPYEIGYLPQQTMVQKDFPATVWEIVLSGTLAHLGRGLFYKKEQKRQAEEQMKTLGIWELRNRCYRNLSGGQQQRVLLARALCATSKILLLDEPVTGLDPKVTMEFYALLQELNKKGITIIMVSHDPHAMSYATHILHIEGNDSFYGTKEQYEKQNKWNLFQNQEVEQ